MTLSSACQRALSPERAQSERAAERPLDERPLWQQRASAELDAEEIELPAGSFAFDHATLHVDRRVEPLWFTIHTLLGWCAARAAGERAQLGYLALMAELEPAVEAAHPAQMELTYVVIPGAAEAAREGLVIRMWRQLEEARRPTLTLLLWSRSEGALEGVALWTHPDVEGASSSVAFSPEAIATLPGTRSLKELDEALKTPSQREALKAPLLSLLATSIWAPLSGAGYVESPILDGPGDEVSARHAGLQPALGLERRERLIEEVPSESAFLPRLDLDALLPPD